MIETEGWKDINKEKPLIGRDVICCCPGESSAPFKIMRLIKNPLIGVEGFENVPEVVWTDDSGRRNKFDTVSRWMEIPWFGKWDHKKEQNTDITSRWELLDL